MVAAHPPIRTEVSQHSLRDAVTEGKREEAFCAVSFPREDNGKTARTIAGLQLRISLWAKLGLTRHGQCIALSTVGVTRSILVTPLRTVGVTWSHH